MQPLESFPAALRSQIRGVFLDIDDTLTTAGRLTPEAYGAMGRLHAAGLLVVPITGRPAGWCDHIARMWPVDGVVGENGAFYFRYDHDSRTFHKRFMATDEERRERRQRIDAVATQILAQVSGCALSSDQFYRETDLAIDYCEDVGPLDETAVDRIVTIMVAAGMTAKISSIHVNGWFGTYDKLTMTRIMLKECFDLDIDVDGDRFVFIGDSPNDQPMFAFFANSIGVQNLERFTGRLDTPPAYITQSAAGAGFVEVAEMLVSAGNPSTV